MCVLNEIKISRFASWLNKTSFSPQSFRLQHNRVSCGLQGAHTRTKQSYTPQQQGCDSQANDVHSRVQRLSFTIMHTHSVLRFLSSSQDMEKLQTINLLDDKKTKNKKKQLVQEAYSLWVNTQVSDWLEEMRSFHECTRGGKTEQDGERHEKSCIIESGKWIPGWTARVRIL